MNISSCYDPFKVNLVIYHVYFKGFLSEYKFSFSGFFYYIHELKLGFGAIGYNNSLIRNLDAIVFSYKIKLPFIMKISPC